jgi:uncharacterized protein (DUF305 family)
VNPSKIAALIAAALTATPALAQSNGMRNMDGMNMPAMKPTPANPYPLAEMDMHKKMMSAIGADATETWARKMVEHHRGAIAMSRIVLRDTRDAKIRAMATKAISEQTREIGELNAWLGSHGKRPQ